MNRKGFQNRILGIVPAAGLSRRMGRVKQSLPFADSTITGTVVRTMLEADVDAVVVVTRSELVGNLDLPTDQRLTIVFNDQPNTGMIDSIRLAVTHLAHDPQRVRSAKSDDGVLVVPGDMPTVPLIAYRQTIEAFRRDPTRIVIASHGAKRGHPIVFPLALATALDEITGGLNELPRQFPDLVTTVDSRDPGVLRDIDDPESYDKLRP